MDLIRRLKYRLYPALSRYIIWATLAEGVLKGSGKPFRGLFADNTPFTKYLLHKVFDGPVRVIRKRRIRIPALRKTIRSSAEDIDLCIAVLPGKYEPEFRGLYTFRGQEYVRQIIDTSGPWDEIRRRFHRNKRKLSNSLHENYHYRVSVDIKDFDFFYHRMHLPLIKKRFGDFSLVDSYDEMKHFFLKGFLLLISSNERIVAGSLCMVENRVLVARRAGVLDGDPEHIRRGAQAALSYCRLLFAKEQGIQKVDTMKSLPFLNDGVYKAKREWGAEVCPDDESQSWVYFFIPRYTQEVVRFFQDNPVIIHTEGGLKGVVGVTDGAGLSEETGKALAKHFSAPGLKGLLLLTPSSTAPLEFSFF